MTRPGATGDIAAREAEARSGGSKKELALIATALIGWSFFIGFANNASFDTADEVSSWFSRSAVPLAVGAWLLARGGRPFAAVLVAVPITVVLQILALNLGQDRGRELWFWEDRSVFHGPDPWQFAGAAIGMVMGLLWTDWHRRSPAAATALAASATAAATFLLAGVGFYDDWLIAPALVVGAAGLLIVWLDRDALRRRPALALVATLVVVGVAALIWGVPSLDRAAKPIGA